VVQAVLFDVDFTLALPGPELGPEGYLRLGARHGLTLDVDRLDEARDEAFARLQRHPDLVHDEDLWIAFTELLIRGMGGDAEGARECAVEMVTLWARHENFTLYDDVLPVFEQLRAHGCKLGLISNGERDLEEFAAHHALAVDVAVGSRAFGRTKPHPSIFAAALERLEVEPTAAAMVGDSYADDIEGARACGLRAFLLDRGGRYPDEPDRLPTLLALPAALGLAPTAV
jgi:HAD superfamily hydrolase (TIGR01549 family)